jgi:nucleoside-diphosphate-sugar epimerase
VDVRDVAKAHVLAMTAPKASNKRILLVSGLFSPQLVVNTIRECFPDLRDRVTEGDPAQILPQGVKSTGWNVSRSYDVFGEDWTYRTLKESLTDTVEDLLRHENQWNA